MLFALGVLRVWVCYFRAFRLWDFLEKNGVWDRKRLGIGHGEVDAKIGIA